MPLELADYEKLARKAVRRFWNNRASARARQQASGISEFRGASYAQRYNVLCQRLMRERLYTTACDLLSSRAAEAARSR